MSLKLRLVLGFPTAFAVALAIVFVPAGSFGFWQGWAYLAALLIPITFTFIYFYRHDPEFLERRLRTDEKEKEQRLLLRWGKPLYLAVFLLPGFDYRFGWSHSLVGAAPLWLTVVSLAVVVGVMAMVHWVFLVNRFASRTVEVDKGQRVVSSGPYRLVRHPLYFAASVLWIFTPTALGSFVAWPVFVLLIPFYVLRLLNEEEVLRRELPGYSEYCLLTRYRLIPFVW
jgi:protein-S-isoprenylcysteine O-methyltransferase Ste14